MGGLVDTHCHLDFHRFDEDREAVLERARAAGISRIVVPAVDLQGITRVLALADHYDLVWAAVGIHPNDIPADRDMGAVMAQLREWSAHPRVVAIGEIGLDYYWDKTPAAIQRQWLLAQLALAADVGLPVILHNREASSDLLRLLTGWIRAGLPASLQGRPGVLHSFSGTERDAGTALALGFFLGFTGPLTYAKAETMRGVAAAAPDERIVIETDAPFLPPHPLRGQRNEPAYLTLTAEKLAAVRGVAVSRLIEMTSGNAAKLFGWNMADLTG